MSTLSRVIDDEQMQKIASEFTRLGARCYLDNAGATLYPESLIKSVNEDLLKNVYMNPHSDKHTSDCIEEIRCLVLKHFNTDPSEYSVVFTSGTTQSLKLVVESFQFASNENDGSFVYLQDCHTSILGLREIAEGKNADVIHVPHNNFLNSLRSIPDSNETNWKEKCYKNEGNTLFVYPGQSNFNGYKYPIDCVVNIKNGCLNSYTKKTAGKINYNWYVMLDAASYVATNKLDLSATKPDFVCLSFYKIFGYPTGLGALLVKNSSEHVLNEKRYYGGGTVDVVLSNEKFHVKRPILHERFEDGTHAFLSIIALKYCFDSLHKLIPKTINADTMDTIAHHVFYLAQDLYNQLKGLRHKNGAEAAVLYMDSDMTDIRSQGSIVTFNLLRDDETYIGYTEFQQIADLFRINVRTGCFCNSGSCLRHLNITSQELKDMYDAGRRCGDELDLVDGRPLGAIRVSFGYYNTSEHVDKLIQMITQCFVPTTLKIPIRQVVYSKSIDNLNSSLIFKEESMKKSIGHLIPNSAPSKDKKTDSRNKLYRFLKEHWPNRHSHHCTRNPSMPGSKEVTIHCTRL